MNIKLIGYPLFTVDGRKKQLQEMHRLFVHGGDMFGIIEDRQKDPLGAMMLDYLDGERDASVEVTSLTLDMWGMKGSTMFRSYAEMDEIERTALSLSRGKILDAGAGAGSHSLYLQGTNRDVDALDISPGSVEVMRRREVKNIIHQNLFALTGKTYQTVLMLMNGMGICGTLDGCNLFLQYVKTILDKDGQVLADSTDLAPLQDDSEHTGIFSGSYYGETEFVMRYQCFRSDPFGWLYIDFNTLQTLVEFNGLCCEQVVSDKCGKYLACIHF